MAGLRHSLSLQTPKYHYISKSMGSKSFTLLDVGSGNHSPAKTVRLFPNCTYHGIDLNKEYAYDKKDEAALTGFYEMDLTQLDYSGIPNAHFDMITMAHIIEHLHNGEKVLEGLDKKLKKGGYIYIEYPGQKSTTLPSMYGTLNFYDDTTHVRIYSVKEIEGILKGLGYRILSSGMRRSWFYIFGIPFNIASILLKGKRISGNVFWDLLGFAEYVYAQKI